MSRSQCATLETKANRHINERRPHERTGPLDRGGGWRARDPHHGCWRNDWLCTGHRWERPSADGSRLDRPLGRLHSPGRLKHADILQTPALPGEIPLGLLAHYLIGIVLTLTYIAVLVVLQVTPTVLTAVTYGVATTVFPWFLLYPAWGYGWLGRKTPGGAHMTRMSLYNHVIFGLGLALWTAVLRPL